MITDFVLEVVEHLHVHRWNDAFHILNTKFLVLRTRLDKLANLINLFVSNQPQACNDERLIPNGIQGLLTGLKIW